MQRSQQTEGHSQSPLPAKNRKAPPERGFVKRLKGIEPSAFCMANDPPSSRAHSQSQKVISPPLRDSAESRKVPFGLGSESRPLPKECGPLLGLGKPGSAIRFCANVGRRNLPLGSGRGAHLLLPRVHFPSPFRGAKIGLHLRASDGRLGDRSYLHDHRRNPGLASPRRLECSSICCGCCWIRRCIASASICSDYRSTTCETWNGGELSGSSCLGGDRRCWL
jgi:hypothetical protein